MRILKITLIFLLSLIVMPSLIGCAGGKTHESTGEFLDDSVISTKVKSSLLADPKIKILQISVETFKGVVQLSGFVNSSAMASRAAEIARRVKGVKQVNNSLIVK